MSKKIAEHQPMEGITVFEVENKIDHLTYLPDMEQIDPSIRLQVEEAFAAYDPANFTEADVRAEVAHWLTLHEQEVPAYSAAKHEGQSLYKLARKGKEVPKKVKSMEISQADVLEVELPFVRFRVACSSGTYIRSLAHSLGMRLGCGAVLTELTREYSHPFGLEVACGLDELSADPGLLVKHLRPLAEALPHWPVLELDEAAEARIRNGMAIPCRDDVGDKALLQRQGMPLALARRSETPQGPCWTVLRGLWN